MLTSLNHVDQRGQLLRKIPLVSNVRCLRSARARLLSLPTKHFIHLDLVLHRHLVCRLLTVKSIPTDVARQTYTPKTVKLGLYGKEDRFLRQTLELRRDLVLLDLGQAVFSAGALTQQTSKPAVLLRTATSGAHAYQQRSVIPSANITMTAFITSSSAPDQTIPCTHTSSLQLTSTPLRGSPYTVCLNCCRNR